MRAFIVVVRALSRGCGMLAACLVAAAVLVVCQMVVLRYLLQASTVWQTEFVTFSLVAATFVGSPYVALTKGHVNVDLVPMHVGHRTRMALALAAAGGALAFSVVACLTGAQLWLEAWEGGWRTHTVWALPLWIPYLAMPVGFGLLALQYLVDILCLLRGDEMPFGLGPEHRP
ncbi:MAG: TRAP transporter small permease [Rhodospirillales bacterium]